MLPKLLSGQVRSIEFHRRGGYYKTLGMAPSERVTTSQELA